jgi:hydrogenase maturation protein HypF
MPGGEAAVREPWRMACAWLPDHPLPGVDAAAWAAVAHMAETGVNSPLTTSVGRLFDAVAALCGLRTHATYEGQAAVELEAACDLAELGAYELPGLDPRPAIESLVRDVAAGVAIGVVAMRFHRGLADATAEACRATGHELVVLSGGVFQNRVLLELTREALDGLRVLVPRLLPPNDGGISYGQAAVAAARG